jgi:hypothetical protein
MAERGAFLVPTLVTYDAMERRGAELGPDRRAVFQGGNRVAEQDARLVL